MDRDLLTILIRDNPWLDDPLHLNEWLDHRLPQPFIPRDVLENKTLRWNLPNKAHLAVMPRQAGKSTVLWAWLKERGVPFLFIDCEQRLICDWCRSAPLFMNELSRLISSPAPLLFEEIQHLENAGLFLKGNRLSFEMQVIYSKSIVPMLSENYCDLHPDKSEAWLIFPNGLPYPVSAEILSRPISRFSNPAALLCESHHLPEGKGRN